MLLRNKTILDKIEKGELHVSFEMFQLHEKLF